MYVYIVLCLSLSVCLSVDFDDFDDLNDYNYSTFWEIFIHNEYQFEGKSVVDKNDTFINPDSTVLPEISFELAIYL